MATYVDFVRSEHKRAEEAHASLGAIEWEVRSLRNQIGALTPDTSPFP